MSATLMLLVALAYAAQVVHAACTIPANAIGPINGQLGACIAGSTVAAGGSCAYCKYLRVSFLLDTHAAMHHVSCTLCHRRRTLIFFSLIFVCMIERRVYDLTWFFLCYFLISQRATTSGQSLLIQLKTSLRPQASQWRSDPPREHWRPNLLVLVRWRPLSSWQKTLRWPRVPTISPLELLHPLPTLTFQQKFQHASQAAETAMRVRSTTGIIMVMTKCVWTQRALLAWPVMLDANCRRHRMTQMARRVRIVQNVSWNLLEHHARGKLRKRAMTAHVA